MATYSCKLSIDCDNDCDKRHSECLDFFLEKYDMELYCEQNLGCRNYLEHWNFEGEDYYLIDNHCADISPVPYDCNDNKLFDDPKDELGQLFLQDAEFIEILAYQP